MVLLSCQSFIETTESSGIYRTTGQSQCQQPMLFDMAKGKDCNLQLSVSQHAEVENAGAKKTFSEHIV